MITNQISKKPWGSEKIIVYTKHYMLKEIIMKPNTCTSVHMHEKKDETMVWVSGKGKVCFDEHEEQLEADEPIVITPCTPHRIIAETDLVILEVSTPELEDIHRFSDEYGRGVDTEV